MAVYYRLTFIMLLVFYVLQYLLFKITIKIYRNYIIQSQLIEMFYFRSAKMGANWPEFRSCFGLFSLKTGVYIIAVIGLVCFSLLLFTFYFNLITKFNDNI